MKGLKQINNYRLTRQIGKGATAIVYEGINDKNNSVVAVKAISTSKFQDKRTSEYFRRELKLLHQLNHENIIKILGIEKTSHNLYIILEYCNGGNLLEYKSYYNKTKKAELNEFFIQKILRQLVKGLEYMHKNHTVHRDIKLENILINFTKFPNEVKKDELPKKLDYSEVTLNDNFQIKIADLGYARELEGGNMASTICGTPITMAPDIALNNNNNNRHEYNNKADLWSLGACTYELLIGQPPFYAKTFQELFQQVNNGKYTLPKNMKLSVEVITFINGLLQFYPEKRFDWDEIINHPFIKNDVSTFHFLDLKTVKEGDAKNLEMNTKNCDNYLWLNFETKGLNVKLDKVNVETIKETELKKKIEENKIENDEIKKVLEEEKKKIEEEKKKLDEEKKKIAVEKEELLKLKKENELLKEKNLKEKKELEKKDKKRKEEDDKMKKKNEENKKKEEDLKNKFNDLEKKIKELENEKEEAKKLKNDAEKMKSEAEKIKKDVDQKNNLLNKQKEEDDKLKKENEKKRLENEKKKDEEIKLKEKKYKEEQEKLKKELNKLKEQQEKLKGEVEEKNKIKDELKQKEIEKEELQKKIQEISDEKDKKIMEIEKEKKEKELEFLEQKEKMEEEALKLKEDLLQKNIEEKKLEIDNLKIENENNENEDDLTLKKLNSIDDWEDLTALSIKLDEEDTKKFISEFVIVEKPNESEDNKHN